MYRRVAALAATLVTLVLGSIARPSDAYMASARSGTEPVFVSLAGVADNRALAASPGDADFDGAGDAYPSSILPAGPLLTLDGISYMLSQGSADNVVARGQTIPVAPGRYVLAHVITASAWGQATGEVTVHYADGGSTRAPLDAPDWYKGPDTPVVQSPFSFTPATRQDLPAALFEQDVWLDPNRIALSLTLPAGRAPAPHVRSLHIFAISLQPAVAGNGIAIIRARSTTGTLPDGAQVVEATVINVGDTWYTPHQPARVTVEAPGVSTSDPASITVLGPGEETRVQIGIRADGVSAGAEHMAAVVARTATGDTSVENTELTVGVPPYAATAASLARHQAPAWYDNAKFGIFIHYGLYSIPAWAPVGGVYAEWYWHSMQQKGSPTYRHQLKTYGPRSSYDDFIARFTAARFDPRAWVELFRRAGARYFVLVSKHHDGFALFRTRYSRRDSVDMGPHKDLVRLLFDVARRYVPDMHRGLYYSLPEWYNPSYPGAPHKKGHFPGGPPRQFVSGKVIPYTGYLPVRDYVRDYQVPQMEELIERYHPDLLWCDIGGPNDSLQVIARLYNDALSGPVHREVAVDNRCGVDAHDFTTPEYRAYPLTVGAKWETSRGLDPHSYGFNANTPWNAYATPQQLITQLVDIVSKNGNFLLDIGPQGDGTIPPVMQDRLTTIGAWLAVNGEAIYNTTYWWRTPQDGNLRFTVRPGTAFYITSLVRPGSQVMVHEPVPIHAGDTITMLGWTGPPLSWHQQDGSLLIDVPPAAQHSGRYAWTFKIAWDRA